MKKKELMKEIKMHERERRKNEQEVIIKDGKWLKESLKLNERKVMKKKKRMKEQNRIDRIQEWMKKGIKENKWTKTETKWQNERERRTLSGWKKKSEKKKKREEENGQAEQRTKEITQ